MPKCKYCNKFVDEDTERVILLRKGNKNQSWCHYDCYINYYKSLKRPKPIEDIKEKADDLSKLTREYIEDKKSKDELYKFLQTLYNVVVLPKYFFIKMNSIYEGTYKGLAKGIPASHLLDMWQRKQSYLLSVYANNCSKGKEMDGIGRINYDLAILLNLYDGYLKWRTDIQEKRLYELKQQQQSVPKVKVQAKKEKVINNIDNEIDEI